MLKVKWKNTEEKLYFRWDL